MRLSPCVLVRPDGWARGEREGYGEPCDVTSLSLSLKDRIYTSSSAREEILTTRENGNGEERLEVREANCAQRPGGVNGIG